MREELSAVPDALGLARATLTTIKTNLVWAFGYNVAAIPLAAAALPWPRFTLQLHEPSADEPLRAVPGPVAPGPVVEGTVEERAEHRRDL